MTAERPRVLFLVTEDWYFCSHRLPIARALKRAGFDVGVACRVADHGPRIEAEGFHLIPLQIERRRLDPVHAFASLVRIVRAYRAFRPDVVHHVALKPAILGSLAARIARVPFTVNAIAGLGYVFTATTTKARLLRPGLKLGLRLLLDGPRTRVIVQNGDDGQALINGGIVHPDHLSLIPGSGVDLGRFRPAPEPLGPVRVTMVSRMIREKGVGELVAAARNLRARGIEVRVTLAGEPDAENPSAIPVTELEGWAAEETVEYMGRVTDVAKLWTESHIAALPSYYGEGVPLSLIEAAAAGRPMIAADGPGLRDIVMDGKTGLLVPPRDADALAEAIARLAADAALRGRMGQNARHLAEDVFGEYAIIARTLEVYRDLMGPRFPA